MTKKETLKQIKAAGMAGSYSAEYGEWRVTYPAKDMQDAAAREAVAYYTPDSADAIATARAMRADMDAPQIEADEQRPNAGGLIVDLAADVVAAALADNPTYRIAPHAADAIKALSAILPDAERQPLHRDHEPDEAAITHHMMTGEEPTRATLADLKAARAFSGEIEASKANAAKIDAAHRGSIPRGPDLGR